MKLLKQYSISEISKLEEKELFKHLIEEAKKAERMDVVRAVVHLRQLRVQKQREEIKIAMEEEIEQQLGIIEVLSSKDLSKEAKDVAYKSALEYLAKTEHIFSQPYYYATKDLLDYALVRGDVEVIDYLMKRRTKISYDTRVRTISQIHATALDRMLRVDAIQGRDDLAEKHIKSAVAGEYGDLVRRYKDTATYYYISEEGYKEQYYRYKTTAKIVAEEECSE